jgi:serine/threonine protein kinase
MLKQQINNYKILSQLGQGGMATVYLAEHKTLGLPVAVKVLSKEFAHNENIRKRFLAEARNMFKMSHPNIIKVTDLIEEGDTVAFVMEYIEGDTLKDNLERKGKLNDDEIKAIFTQMLEAVGYVHEQGLIHRDIKPSNFMISPNGQVKLLDFGIAKNTDTNSAEYTQTSTSQQMGTPMYMSPEQVNETKSVTAQSDIYSLGVVLWQMVMGQKPYDTRTLSNFELQLKIVQEPLALTHKIWDSCIQKATHKNLESRYTSTHLFLNDLQNPAAAEVDKTVFEKNDDKTIFENLLVDESFPERVKSCFHKIYYDLGLDIYAEIINPISLETSSEYNLIFHEGLAYDFGCFSFKINKIEFLLGVYNNEWCLIFNSHRYLNFKEIKELTRINDLNLSSKIITLIIEMVNCFTTNEYYNKLGEYEMFIKKENESCKIDNVQFDITIFNELLNKYQIIQSGKLFLYPEINEKKGVNFISKFENLLIPTIKEYSFLLLHDDTLFGKCDEGLSIILADEGKLFILISEDNKPLHISTINFDHHIFPRINDINIKGVFSTGVELILNNSNAVSYKTLVGNTSSNFEIFAKHFIAIFNSKKN